MTLTAFYKALTDLRATGHMVKNMPVITGKASTSDINSRTDAKDTIRGIVKDVYVIKMSGGKKTVTFSRVLHVFGIDHSMIFVPNLFDYNQTVEFTNKKCIFKKDNCTVDVRERAGEKYCVNVQQLSEKAFAIVNVT